MYLNIQFLEKAINKFPKGLMVHKLLTSVHSQILSQGNIAIAGSQGYPFLEKKNPQLQESLNSFYIVEFLD